MGEVREDVIRLGLVGIGKIARDQHLPALAADPRFAVVATASREGSLDGVPAHADIAAMIAGGHALDAVSLCTPPAGRHAIAVAAIEAELHVMLEKPSAATLGEAEDLAARARAKGVTLFAAWHSREAAAVADARTWLAGRRTDAVRITWKEDIRCWHPGQEWILDDGGFGVFDPGINALSIVTRILPDPITVEAAQIDIPAGRASPIAAKLRLRAGDSPIDAVFDFRQTGLQHWDIEVDTDAGTMRLSDGGATLAIDGHRMVTGEAREYPRLYARFATLIAANDADIDLSPLRLVSEALRIATVTITPPFHF